MENLDIIIFIISFISFLIAAYCFMRVLLYPLLKIILGEKQLRNDPKLKDSLEYFSAAGLYPLQNWTDKERAEWIKAWWKYALFGLILFTIAMITWLIIDKYY